MQQRTRLLAGHHRKRVFFPRFKRGHVTMSRSARRLMDNVVFCPKIL
ncbi:hypothetical protein [Formivibrio citricus]|nr:hypothetical protein [Formivibrio citricus]